MGQTSQDALFHQSQRAVALEHVLVEFRQPELVWTQFERNCPPQTVQSQLADPVAQHLSRQSDVARN